MPVRSERPDSSAPHGGTTAFESGSGVGLWSEDERPDGWSSSRSEFDPVWGSLGAQMGRGAGDWADRDEEPTGGVVVDVEVLGDSLHLSGKIDLGQFDRLSGWLNMQSGFIRLRDARQVDAAPAAHVEQQEGKLWVRLNQIVVIADLSVRQIRSGAPIVEKQRRRVSILTRCFELSGNIHVHAHGEMAQFLEADSRFLPITELTVRRLSGSGQLSRFPSAMVNREQLVTLLEDSESPEIGVDREALRSA
jgi:hypothetical protein